MTVLNAKVGVDELGPEGVEGDDPRVEVLDDDGVPGSVGVTGGAVETSVIGGGRSEVLGDSEVVEGGSDVEGKLGRSKRQ
jgi:hypothetical protein